MQLTVVLASTMLLAAASSCNAASVLVYAAGSLRPAFTEIGRTFEAEAGTTVRFEFGTSGLLKDRIDAGEPAQVFASANTEHPRELVNAGKAQNVAVFARNRLCALVGAMVPAGVDLLALMLDPAVKLGTSTPKADPSGDYAWEVFHKAEAIKPGSFNALSRKALQLTGGANSPPPLDRTVYGVLVAENEADIFLTYRTNATLAVEEQPQLRLIDLPPALLVGAEYGVAVMNGAPASASQFVDFLRGPEGQSILRKFGFR